MREAGEILAARAVVLLITVSIIFNLKQCVDQRFLRSAAEIAVFKCENHKPDKAPCSAALQNDMPLMAGRYCPRDPHRLDGGTE